jgi:cytochrome c-type biogenesis protein CcmH/NrfG
MKNLNIIITVIVIVVLTAAAFLVAKIIRIQSASKVDLSERVSIEKVALKEEDIEQKRKLIWKYDEQGDRESLIQTAEEYLKLVPQDESIWVLLAENYMWSDKLIEAEKAVKEALKLDAKFPWGLRALAAIYRVKAEHSPQLKQEYLSKAQLKIEEALEIAPDDPWVNIEAAHIYLAQGREGEALEVTNKAIELRPEEKHFLDLKEQILSGVEE